MKKEIMSSRQIQSLIFSFGIGSYLLYNMGASVKQDAWIASSIATVISIPIVMMYGYIVNSYPGKNIYDITEILFGRVIGSIINFIFIMYTFILAAFIIGDFVTFVKITSLVETPKVITMACIGILSIWILRSGIEVLCAWAHFFLRYIIIFMVIFWIMLIPQMHPSKLAPVFYNGFSNIMSESIKLIFFPVTEVIIFTSFFNYVEFKNSKIFVKPVFLGSMVGTAAIIINIMLLGPIAYESFYYPGYEAIKRLQFGGEFQRVEIMIAIAFTVIQFLQVNYCILGTLKGIQKICKLKGYREILVPVIIFIINFALIMFKGHMESIEFVKNLWSTYAFIMQVCIPFLIFIIIFIKKKQINLKNDKVKN